MIFWRDKKGNKLTWKQFFKRWGEGIQGITPYQQVKTEMFGTRLIIIGLVCGIVVSIYAFKNMWWVCIILLGALLNTTLSYLSQLQKYKFLKKMEEV